MSTKVNIISLTDRQRLITSVALNLLKDNYTNADWVVFLDKKPIDKPTSNEINEVLIEIGLDRIL